MTTYTVLLTDIDNAELQQALADTGLSAEAFLVETIQSELATRRMRRLCPRTVTGDKTLDCMTRTVQRHEEGTDDVNAYIGSTVRNRIHRRVRDEVREITA